MTSHGKIRDLNRNRTFAGRFLLHFDSLDSTNDYCLKNISVLQKPGLVVVADRQTQGRGSRGRTWEPGKGEHLFCSFVIHPEIRQEFIPSMTLFAGLAVFRAISSLGITQASIKWPNDILIAEKKVCGILCESRITPEMKAVVAGIGINISGGPEQFPESLREKVTTLSKHGIQITNIELVDLIAGKLDEILAGIKSSSALNAIFQDW
ncbi:MAG: biotin--[acetyl-CoA-carboxylase] ligase, partial [Thermodesulfatator sp.]